MRKYVVFIFFVLFQMLIPPVSGEGRTVISLNGTWQFEQTLQAFPPAKFTRTIPVPGLVHLAEPRIEDYDRFFRRPEKVEAKQEHNLYDIDYAPVEFPITQAIRFGEENEILIRIGDRV